MSKHFNVLLLALIAFLATACSSSAETQEAAEVPEPIPVLQVFASQMRYSQHYPSATVTVYKDGNTSTAEIPYESCEIYKKSQIYKCYTYPFNLDGKVLTVNPNDTLAGDIIITEFSSENIVLKAIMYAIYFMLGFVFVGFVITILMDIFDW